MEIHLVYNHPQQHVYMIQLQGADNDPDKIKKVKAALAAEGRKVTVHKGLSCSTITMTCAPGLDLDELNGKIQNY